MTAHLARIALLVLLAACGGSPKKEPRGKVVVTDVTAPELLEPIAWAGEVELAPESHKTLDAVAATLTNNQEIRLIEVGVFYLEGDQAARQQIADRRARLIVGYLVGKQVEAERLEAAGYIEPTEDNKTSSVRFLILKRDPTR
ncbi:MAG TPA: OmpA family protein [Kofleriaceae bacterium]|nr:OmpA family protein [Kofleriaceae bacterium]